MKNKILLAIVSLTLVSCGGERSTAQAVSGLMSGLASASNSSSLNMQSQGQSRGTLKAKINSIGEGILLQQYYAPSASTSAVTVCDAFETAIQSDLGSSCSVTSCSGDGSTSLSFAIGCTAVDDSVSCGSETYTLSNFAYTATMSYAVSNTTLAFTYDMDMNGDVAGGGLSGAVDCSVGFDFNYDLSSGAPTTEPTMDCDDLNFSCTVGGAAVTCADLQTGADGFACN